MNVDQRLVVGLHLVGAAGIRENVQVNLPAQQAAALVDVICPELVTLLECQPIGGEISS